MKCFTTCGAEGLILDAKTGRLYCPTCWEAISDAIKGQDHEDDQDTSEIETDDFDPLAIQRDENWNDFNFPADDDSD